jgi:hypothetical protein
VERRADQGRADDHGGNVCNASPAGAYEPLIRPVDDRRSSALYRKTVSLRILEYFLGEVIGTRD